MKNYILPIIQIILSVILIIVILLQQQGTGLGSAFGGGDAMFRTKRGLEKGLFYATIVISILFFITAILNVTFS